MSCVLGHYFWFLDRNMVPGPARGITQVWGVPSPIDTVFTRCNCQGKTYIFKVYLPLILLIVLLRVRDTPLDFVCISWVLWFVTFAGTAVLEIWKWCFGQWLPEAHSNGIWWAAGSHHSCSVRASTPEQKRIGLLLQARWATMFKRSWLNEKLVAAFLVFRIIVLFNPCCQLELRGIQNLMPEFKKKKKKVWFWHLIDSN